MTPDGSSLWSHKQPLNPILSHFKPIHIYKSYFSKICFIVIINNLLLSDFWTNILCTTNFSHALQYWLNYTHYEVWQCKIFFLLQTYCSICYTGLKIIKPWILTMKMKWLLQRGLIAVQVAWLLPCASLAAFPDQSAVVKEELVFTFPYYISVKLKCCARFLLCWTQINLHEHNDYFHMTPMWSVHPLEGSEKVQRKVFWCMSTPHKHYSESCQKVTTGMLRENQNVSFQY
jgi:hypothetical protein